MTKSHHIPARLIILRLSKGRTGCLHPSLTKACTQRHPGQREARWSLVSFCGSSLSPAGKVSGRARQERKLLKMHLASSANSESLLHENLLSLKFIFLSADCKFRASESFKGHPALEGSLPDRHVRQLPLCSYNQCSSHADVQLGEGSTGSGHL